jgi:hypothetical protein
VWRFIDAELNSAPEVPFRPTKPTIHEIKASATSLVNLSVEERELYKLMLADFKEDQQINRLATHFRKSLTTSSQQSQKTICISSKTSQRFTTC